MSIGKNIQTLRKENKMSQDQLAQKCNVSRQTISRWECDEVLPDTNNLITLSKLFNKSLDEIVFDHTKDESNLESSNTKKKNNNHKIFNIFIIVLLLISLIFNIKLLSPNTNENTLYGTWIYDSNGYEIKLTLQENVSDENYDNILIYLYYQDHFDKAESEYETKYSKYSIQDNQNRGTRYRTINGDFFYYNEITNKIDLILENDFEGRSTFTLVKEK